MIRAIIILQVAVLLLLGYGLLVDWRGILPFDYFPPRTVMSVCAVAALAAPVVATVIAFFQSGCPRRGVEAVTSAGIGLSSIVLLSLLAQ